MPVISALPSIARRRGVRVLMTTPLLNKPGGVSQYLSVLLPYVQHEMRCFTIGSRKDAESGVTSAVRLLQDWILFANTMRTRSFDLVHLNPSVGSKALLRDGVLLLIAKVFRKPVVVFMHGWDEDFERRVLNRLAWLFRAVFGRADCFVVLGAEFEKKLKSLGYSKAIFRQAAPVEEGIFRGCKEYVAARKLRSGGRGCRILFLARIERTKGIYEALEAYGIIKQSFPSASLVVAGDGSELHNAIEYARTKNLADLSFRGHVAGAEKLEIFKSSDIYLFPSYTEGLPISVLEAMACGLPIVTSAVGGLHDFFEDGKMGYMSQNAQPEILAALVSRLMNDPDLCSQIGSFNSQYAREHFTGEHVAAQLEHIYRYLLERAV